MVKAKAQPGRSERAAARRQAARLVSWQVLGQGLAAAVCLYLGFGFLVAPLLLRSAIQDRLSRRIGRAITVGRVQTNPIGLSFSLQRVTVAARYGASTCMSAESVEVDVAGASLVKRGLVMDSLHVRGLRLRLVRQQDGALNVADLQRPLQELAGDLAVSVGAFDIAEAAIVLWDTARNTHHYLTGIHVSAPLLAGADQGQQRPILASAFGYCDGAPFTLRARLKLFPDLKEVRVALSVRGLGLTRYAGYVPRDMALSLRNGTLDAQLTVAYQQQFARRPSLTVAGRLTAHDLEVADAADPRACQLPQLEVSLLPANLLGGELHLEQVALSHPQLHLERRADGGLSHALSPFWAGLRQRWVAAGRPGVDVDAVDVDNGSLRFVDTSGDRSFRTTFGSLRLQARQLSTHAGRTGTLQASAISEAQESIEARLTVGLAPPAVTGTIACQGLDLPRYAPYWQGLTDLRVETGKVSGSTRLALAELDAAPTVTLSDLSLRVESLAASRPGRGMPLLALATLNASDGRVDTKQRLIRFATVIAREGSLRFTRQSFGLAPGAELGQTVRTPAAPPPAAAAESVAAIDTPLNISTRRGQVRIARFAGQGLAKTPGQPPAQASPAPDDETGLLLDGWRLTLDNLKCDQCAVTVEDRLQTPAVTTELDQITIRLADVCVPATAPSPVTTALRLNRTGTLTGEGTVQFTPFDATLKVRLDQLDLPALRPRLGPRADAVVSQGTMSGHGDLELGLSATTGIGFRYRGTTDIRDLVVTNRNGQGQPLSAKRVEITAAAVDSDTGATPVEQVTWQEPSIEVEVGPDGRPGLGRLIRDQTTALREVLFSLLLGRPPPGAAVESAAATAARATPGTVSIQDGRINLVARRPAGVSALALNRVNGTITTGNGGESDLQLDGAMGTAGTFSVRGTVSSWDALAAPGAELLIKASQIDLPAFTRQAENSFGHAIERGSASVESQVRLNEQELSADTELVLCDLTVRPTAAATGRSRSPLPFALALWRDPEGKVRLSLPLRVVTPRGKAGWGLLEELGQMLQIRISQAVADPFQAIAELTRQPPDALRALVFDPGQADIDPVNRSRIEALVQALIQRPGLTLQVRGCADTVRDRDALLQSRRREALKAEKRRQAVARGRPIPAQQDVRVEDSEVEEILRRAYKAATLPQPSRLAERTTPEPTRDALEAWFRARLEVSADALVALATERANRVAAVFLGSTQLGAARLEVLAAAIGTPPESGGAAPAHYCRAVFHLR